MEENSISIQTNIITCDPNDDVLSIKQQEPNFHSPTRRSFLNECIRQIYIINGQFNALPTNPSPTIFIKQHIRRQINQILAAPQQQSRRDSLQRVKRQLFRENKAKTRKCRKPQRNSNRSLQCYNFRAVRSTLGVQKVRRNYMDVARAAIMQQSRLNRKRKFVACERNSTKLHLNTSDDVYHAAHNTITKLCKYHGNMARQQPQRERSPEEQLRREHSTDACQLTMHAQQLQDILVQKQYQDQILTYSRVIEESVRSVYYMKALLNLMMDHEETLYV